MTSTIHIIDDEESIRDSLAFLLASRGLSAQAWPSGEAFLEALPIEDCGCVILDVRMEGLSGPEVFDRLRAKGWTAPVIFLTGHADVPVAVQTLKAGAFDFVEKPFNDNLLVDLVLKAVAAHETRHALIGHRQDLQRRLQTLSKRETQVMHLMLQGNLNKQIAHELGISIRTVEVHRSRVLEKMGARNTTELAGMLADVDSLSQEII
ncbi:two-component system response regulator [Paramesorhizobium deserti]|uniref:Two-component system response regulator n=1 Tax=Paramesorhizobium deserti TaxID=1494590 RepID=A0A135HY88_9HYPH|nr:response regulator [Paramesorhizobium deserti]KXF78155.1 two-component system response regulator [Paramesorhizobium deserti]